MKTTLLELAGFGAVAYGCFLAWPPLGFIVGGALLALVAYLIDRGVG
jgi:hypothetical protein